MKRIKENDGMRSKQFTMKEIGTSEESMARIFFYDNYKVYYIPIDLTSLDTKQCYNVTNHPILSLVMQAYIVCIQSMAVMLTFLQHMEFYVYIVFRDSKIGFREEVKDSTYE